MQATWVQSLIGELRSHMPHGMAKKQTTVTKSPKPTNQNRDRAEQARDTAARQLAQAEQEGQAALQQLKSAHEEEVNQLQEKWVGGGCAQGMGGPDLVSRV